VAEIVEPTGRILGEVPEVRAVHRAPAEVRG